MKKLKAFIKGTVEIQVFGKHPERILNVCADLGVDFRNFNMEDENCAVISTDVAGLRRLSKEQLPWKLQTLKLRGRALIAKRIRKRYVFAAVLMLCAVALWSVNQRVWRIEVSGCETVPESKVIAVLDELGVSIGAKCSDIDSYRIRNSALLRIDELIWLSVNVNGSSAQVTVRERTSPVEIANIYEPADLVAAKDGMIVSVSALNGSVCVKKGDTVANGQILVSGRMASKLQTSREVRALGEVWARTWYELEAVTPLEYIGKNYTGQEETKNSIVFGRQRINLHISSGIPYEFCDKINTMEWCKIPNLVMLPFGLVKESYLEYNPVQLQESIFAAESRLQENLLQQLKKEIGSGEVKAVEYSTKEENGLVKVTLYAECLEQIAVSRPIENVYSEEQ